MTCRRSQRSLDVTKIYENNIRRIRGFPGTEWAKDMVKSGGGLWLMQLFVFKKKFPFTISYVIQVKGFPMRLSQLLGTCRMLQAN